MAGRAIRTILFGLFVGPGPIAGLGPLWLSGWRLHRPFFGLWPLRPAGAALFVAGAGVLTECFVRFVRRGRGTPGPWEPPQALVVSGLYRYVRNPMYVGVVAAILGQALLIGNVAVFAYAVAAWVLFTAFVLAYEEPTLRRTFGAQYEDYCERVNRWIPRPPGLRRARPAREGR